MSFALSTGNTVYASASASITSQTDTTATVKVTASAYLTNGWVEASGVIASIYIDGALRSSQTVLGNGTYYQASYGTKSVSYSMAIGKTTEARDVAWTVQFWKVASGSITTVGQANTGKVSVAKKTSYSVTFDANGGTAAPDAQTKWYSEDLELSSTAPTRTGHVFQGWATSADAESAEYAAGAVYTENAALSLYAVWEAEEYAVTFDANGGDGAPSAVVKTYGVDLTLPTAIPTRTNYNFLGWATSDSAAVAEYAAGGTFAANAATTLYAVWELAYWSPKIIGLTADRCDSDGTHNDYGTYVMVSFDWETCQILGDNEAASCVISAGGESEPISISGTGGTVAVVVGGSLSVDSQHSVAVTLADSMGGTAARGVIVLKADFPMDFKAGGTGAAFGKSAELDALDVNWEAVFRKGVIVGDPDGDHRVITEKGPLGVEYGGTGATSAAEAIASLGIDEMIESVKSKTWVFGIRARGAGEVQSGTVTAGWQGTTAGSVLLAGTDGWSDYLTVNTLSYTLSKPGVYRCVFRFHGGLGAAGRLGAAWFNGEDEVASDWAYMSSTQYCTVVTELIVNVDEDGYTITPKVYAGNTTYKKFTGGQCTNFTIEYLGEL